MESSKAKFNNITMPLINTPSRAKKKALSASPTYVNMKHIVLGTPEYIEHQSIVKALHVAFTVAATEASSPSVNNDVTPKSYKDEEWQIFASSAAGPSSLGPLFLRTPQSWAPDGQIARKLTRMEHSLYTFTVRSLGTTVASLLKDSLKLSKSTILNPSRPLPPMSLFARCLH